jgi:hypothetical protein
MSTPLRFERSAKGATCAWAAGCERTAARGLRLCARHRRRLKRMGQEHLARSETSAPPDRHEREEG